ELAAGFDQQQTELAELSKYLDAEVDGTPDELSAQLHGLLQDTVTLAKLPELHRLRSSLERLGLAELLSDLAARDLTPDAALAAFEHAWLWSLVEHLRLADPR